jgi:Vitamin K-dependent gamma-carboxylase
MFKNIHTYLNKESSNAPLVVFRIFFGLLMFISTVRFISMGWVFNFYIAPKIYFPFEGFYWLKPLEGNLMYGVFGIMLIASLGIMLGLFYRISAILFFLSFTYVELLDKSNYLNHYYFVSIIAFLLIFLPAHKRFSLDYFFKRVHATNKTSNWILWILKAQLSIVYIYAGIAKLNVDWLFNALPLKIWLPAQSHLPLIGGLLTYEWIAYLFSWFGAFYDLFIVFFLLKARTRIYAYAFVIVFHVLTRILFPIGMFPYIMIVSTLIFFSSNFHETLLKIFSRTLRTGNSIFIYDPIQISKSFKYLIVLFFIVQVLFPLRYLAYPGNLYWTEQGYRFSWRVMLMEKAGTAFFYVEDAATGKRVEVNNREFLSMNQEKMMSTQPDMMVQYAHHLKKYYTEKGISEPKVYADVFVNLNGRGSRRFIDAAIDLSAAENTWRPKNWILSDEN